MLAPLELETTSPERSGERDKPESHAPPPPLWRKLSAEVVGTFLLTFVDAGGAMIAAMSGGQITSAARSAAAGLIVMAMIFAISDMSGAHINPAVTLAFAMRGSFPWRRVPWYWLAEFTGAILAALCLRSLFGNIEHTGMTMPHFGAGAALAFEILLTFLLVSVILATATQEAVIGKEAALAVGGTVAACGLFSRPISGASMNPARSLGPALVGGAINLSWIYLLGPLLGASLAVIGCWIIHGKRKSDEKKAAQGSAES